MQICFRGYDFDIKKHFRLKLLKKVLLSNLFSRKLFYNHKKFSTKVFSQNFIFCKPFFEETMLQP